MIELASDSFVILKLVNDHFKRAVNRWKHEEENPDVSELGVLLENRAHARVIALAVLLDISVVTRLKKDLVIRPRSICSAFLRRGRYFRCFLLYFYAGTAVRRLMSLTGCVKPIRRICSASIVASGTGMAVCPTLRCVAGTANFHSKVYAVFPHVFTEAGKEMARGFLRRVCAAYVAMGVANELSSSSV